MFSNNNSINSGLFFLHVFFVLVLFSCGEGNTNQPKSEAEREYMIVYNLPTDPDSSDNYEVFGMTMEGSNKRNLTNNEDVAWTYHGAKDKVYFISDRDTCQRCYFLYEMNSKGGNIKKLSDLQLEDSWMSSRNDGKEMVVAGRIGKEIRYQLFIVDLTTGAYTQITNDTAALHRDPVFSPDGNQLVFAYKAHKHSRDEHEELHIMPSNGGSMKQLTYYPESDTLINSFGYKAGAPQWHPTENFITYISEQAGRHSIYAVSPIGDKQWKLTDHSYSEGWHDWSSDGKWLAFDSSDPDGKQYHIMLMNWKTKEVKQLTDDMYKYQQAPVFVELN